MRFTDQAAVAIKTSQHHSSERIYENRIGSVIYEIDVAGTDEFLRWVLGFGAEAEFLEPENIRNKMIDFLKSALKIYL
jgi:predicted DNA-binding transcriptional regulator YafY